VLGYWGVGEWGEREAWEAWEAWGDNLIPDISQLYTVPCSLFPVPCSLPSPTILYPTKVYKYLLLKISNLKRKKETRKKRSTSGDIIL